MKYFLWMVLIGWLLFSILLHLAPPLGRWGSWAHPVMLFYGERTQEIQASGHAILVGGMTFLMMGLLRGNPRIRACMLTLGIALLFAVTMEILQGLLPCGFQRQCDPVDLLPAMVGALIGCLAGLGFPRAKG